MVRILAIYTSFHRKLQIANDDEKFKALVRILGFQDFPKEIFLKFLYDPVEMD